MSSSNSEEKEIEEIEELSNKEEDEEDKEDKEEEKEKEEPDEDKVNTIQLKLGDVIFIVDPANEILNNKTFLIQYIDKERIRLIDTKDYNTTKLKIDSEGIIVPGTITEIDILYRNDESGYARQNNLLPNTWVNIYFGGDTPAIITGQITNLEEDMIELTIHPDKDKIFINFGYKGIPEDLYIDNIEIRKAPESVDADERVDADIERDQDLDDMLNNALNPSSEYEEAVEELLDDIESLEQDISDESVYENENIQMLEQLEKLNKNKNNKKDIIIREDEILFGNELGAIRQSIEASESEERYNIETQTNDLMEDMLSKVPYNQRRDSVLNKIHTITERFKQLRTQFSNLDTYGNVLSAKINGANWKPLVENLTHFETLLYWILPVVKNIKKVYNVENVEDSKYSDIVLLNTSENIDNIKDIIDNFNSNVIPDEQNKYITLFKDLSPYFCPFEEVPFESTQDIIHSFEVKRNLNTIVNNLDNFYSSTVNITNNYLEKMVDKNNPEESVRDMIDTHRFYNQPYTSGLSRLETIKLTAKSLLVKSVKLTNPDVMEIKSIMTLPEPVIRFSHVNLPGTNLMEKSILNTNFLNYSRLLKPKTNVQNINVDSVGTELELTEENFVNNIKNYNVTKNILQSNREETNEIITKEEKYKRYLNAFIPKTRVLFELMKKYIKGKLSITKVVEYLEPFLIYTDDLTYMQYTEMSQFVKEKINEYNIRLKVIGQAFLTLIKTKSLSENKNYATLKNLLFSKTKFKIGNILEDVYDISDLTQPEKLTDSELMSEIIAFNYGNAFNYAISLNNINLMLPENVSAIISEEETKVGASMKKAEDSNKCITYTIAKQYPNVNELEKDNGKTIYFDRNFDKTNYGLLDDNKTALLDKEIEKAQKTMTPEKYEEFVISKLQSKFKYSEKDAKYMAETLINGMKKVVEGDIAIVHDLEEDKINYYKRTHNRWEEDDTIPKDTFINSQDMLCNFQRNCIEVEKKYSIQCETYDLNKKELTKSALEEIMREFDEKYRLSKEILETEMSKKYDYYLGITDKLKSIKDYNFLKYTIAQYTIGSKNGTGDGDKEMVVSPFLPLMEMVLSQADFIKKQNDLIRFAQRFTRDANRNITDVEDEDPHWRYCIKTNTKLMPAFLYTLSSAFVQNPDNYLIVMEEIIQTNGKISDDGDSWVDEFSGRIIRRRNLDTDEGFTASGFRDSSREIMEEDEGDAILKGVKTQDIGKNNKNEKAVMKVETPETNAAIRVINSLAYFMGINIDTVFEFIIKLFNNILLITLAKEEDYNKRVEQASKAKKILPPYKENYNSTILYVAASAFLIGIQTSMPDVRSRKTFPGCVTSFKGYPFDGPGDLSAIKYLACVIKKLGRATEPWTVVEKKTADYIENQIKKTIDLAFIPHPDVIQKFAEKTEYLLTTPADSYIPEEHSILTWGQFLPPLNNIKITGLTNISSEFKVALKNELKSGIGKQTEKILVIESKIILFSLAIQEKIQKVLDKKRMLLIKASNEPFLENACCNSDKKDAGETVLQYFGKEDVDILQYNDIVCGLSNCIYDIIDLTKAPYLFSKLNTKNVYPPMGSEFTEETIYRAFIKFCRFQSMLPLNMELTAVCKEKPNFLRQTDSIYDKIRKLKQDGRHYNNAQMLRLMDVVNRQNIVHVNTDYPIVTPVQKIRDLLENMANGQEEVVPQSLRENISNILDTYDIAVDEDTDPMRDLKNYLDRTNKEMRAEIFKFINTYADVLKNKKSYVKLILENLMKWDDLNDTRNQEYKISDDSMYNATQFIKSYLKNVVVVFPEIISNSVNYEHIKIQKYLGLSNFHETEIKDFVKKYYEGLNNFYTDKSLTKILKEIQFKCVNLLYFANETPSLTNILYKGSETHSIFDKRTSMLLFENYFLTSLITYINLTDDDDMIVLEINPTGSLDEGYGGEDNDEEMFEGKSNDNYLTNGNAQRRTGDKLGFKKKVANLLYTFLNIMNDHKDKINMTYDKIQDIKFKQSEREKDTFTDRLESLGAQGRAVDTILKINKLGVWSKGLQKGLRKYVKETYDEERELAEIMGGIEKSVRRRKNVVDGNADIEVEEELERRDSEAIINNEVNNISGFEGENNDNDDGADESDNYYND